MDTCIQQKSYSHLHYHVRYLLSRHIHCWLPTSYCPGCGPYALSLPSLQLILAVFHALRPHQWLVLVTLVCRKTSCKLCSYVPCNDGFQYAESPLTHEIWCNGWIKLKMDCNSKISFKDIICSSFCLRTIAYNTLHCFDLGLRCTQFLTERTETICHAVITR